MSVYPDLSNSKIICFDIETYDPELKEKGPGVYRKDGNILGVAIANEQGFAEYYNLGHSGISKEEHNKNKKYLDEVLGFPCGKLGTNILYDLDWVENWLGLKVNGQLHDVQVAEPLIDENQGHYSLDFLSKKYLGIGKYKGEIEQFCSDHNLKGDSRKWLWKMSYEMVRKYAIVDVKNPLAIFKIQWKILVEQDLITLYHTEMDLHRLLLQMRKTGVRVDENKVNEGIEYLHGFIKEKSESLWQNYGKFNFNSSQQIAHKLKRQGIPYPLTEKGNPNLDKSVLKGMNTDLTNRIVEVKSAAKTLSTFFVNAFTHYNIQGRLHCCFHPLKTDEYGTVSGRLSSSNPNLQQIPSQEETHYKLCRSVFIPEENHWWGKVDYSQIEYRIIAHYSTGERSDYIKAQYIKNKDTDYHQLIMDITGFNRIVAKKLNFGRAYCMGVETTMRLCNWTREEATEFIEAYDREVPFIKTTRNKIVGVAKARGFIKTILGRRARMTDYMRENRKEYIMFNRLIQGTAADVLKKGMVDAYKAGIFNTLKPHLTVHDELDQSIPKNKEGLEAFAELGNTMENAVPLIVPVKVDKEFGDNWASLQEYDPEQTYLF